MRYQIKAKLIGHTHIAAVTAVGDGRTLLQGFPATSLAAALESIHATLVCLTEEARQAAASARHKEIKEPIHAAV